MHVYRPYIRIESSDFRRAINPVFQIGIAKILLRSPSNLSGTVLWLRSECSPYDATFAAFSAYSERHSLKFGRYLTSRVADIPEYSGSFESTSQLPNSLLITTCHTLHTTYQREDVTRMPPKGGNAKKEGGRAKKAENEVSFVLPPTSLTFHESTPLLWAIHDYSSANDTRRRKLPMLKKRRKLKKLMSGSRAVSSSIHRQPVLRLGSGAGVPRDYTRLVRYKESGSDADEK
jgi:hypothetical protein